MQTAINHLKVILNNKWTKCHAPMTNKEAHYSGHTIFIFGDGFLNPVNSFHDEALNKVSCTLCHQIKNHVGMRRSYILDSPSRNVW